LARSRHHYVPQCYLKRWQNASGKVACLLADKNNKIVENAPINLGFQRYYYSQPNEDGSLENDRLEDFFSKAESSFSVVADKIQIGAEFSKTEFHLLMNFVSAMHARVPAMRECIEQFLASGVVAVVKALEENGEIPVNPDSGLSILQSAQITIDPHRSLHAMAHVIQGFAKIIGHLGFCIVKNETELLFITSDNPVVMFDPRDSGTPYTCKGSDCVFVLFPIDPHHLLLGSTELRQDFLEIGEPWIAPCDDLKKIEMFNEKIAQFSYREMYATRKSDLDKYAAYSATSPVMETIWLKRGESWLPIRNWAFGPRPKLPKWRGRR
jgi:hypothetical protein